MFSTNPFQLFLEQLKNDGITTNVLLRVEHGEPAQFATVDDDFLREGNIGHPVILIVDPVFRKPN